MPNLSLDSRACAFEPVAVMSGAEGVNVRLVGDAGQTITLRMNETSAFHLAALLVAGAAKPQPG